MKIVFSRDMEEEKRFGTSPLFESMPSVEPTPSYLLIPRKEKQMAKKSTKKKKTKKK